MSITNKPKESYNPLHDVCAPEGGEVIDSYDKEAYQAAHDPCADEGGKDSAGCVKEQYDSGHKACNPSLRQPPARPDTSRLRFLNLSFEEGIFASPVRDFSNAMWVLSERIPGWNSTNFNFIEIFKAPRGVDGGYHLEINSDGADTIFQDAEVDIIEDSVLEISYYLKNRRNAADDINVKVEQISPSPQVYYEGSHSVTSTSWVRFFSGDIPIDTFTGILRLSFSSPTRATANSHVDNIQLNVRAA